MRNLSLILLAAFTLVLAEFPAHGQNAEPQSPIKKKSVKPGINQSFLDPELDALANVGLEDLVDTLVLCISSAQHGVLKMEFGALAHAYALDLASVNLGRRAIV